MSTEITVSLAAAAFLPGEPCEGSVKWFTESNPRSMEIRLFWYTSGKGDRDTELIDSQRVDTIGRSGEHEFSFRLPQTPYSFSGKLISLIWAIEAVFQPGGETGRSEFVMAPDRKEIILETAA